MLRRARVDRFSVYGDARVSLRPPVDWHMDPLDARRFRDSLPKLRFLDPLIWVYAHDGDLPALRRALAIVLDWARANPLGGAGTTAAAWIDKVTGDRVPYISYVTRAAACQGMLSHREAKLLLRSIATHQRVLLRKAEVDRTNHGLFVGDGLALLARYFQFERKAREWEHAARRQFMTTLRGRLSDGVWLEHSTNYQFLAIRAVERFVAYTNHQEAARLLRAMKQAAGWFVEPDDQMTLFGDTYLFRVPSWAVRKAHEESGLRVFRKAGFAFAKGDGPGGAGTGYLAVTDGFHNATHKHADELSFELYDHGVRIVSDTGLYHKDPGAIRDFVLSAPAHSTLTVDGRDFPIGIRSRPYGSGLVASGEGAGWYAIEGRNPLLRRQGVAHTRLFLYRPGVALVIVDLLRSPESHTYARYIQLGPQVRITEAEGSALGLAAPGFNGSLHDAPLPAPAELSRVRGEHHPLAGLTSPRFRVFRPRWTVKLASQASDSNRAATLSLNRDGLEATGVKAHRRVVGVTLRGRRGQRGRLVVTRKGRDLAISPQGGP